MRRLECMADPPFCALVRLAGAGQKARIATAARPP
jgi:hypothetical protein